jgi:DNA transformation protein
LGDKLHGLDLVQTVVTPRVTFPAPEALTETPFRHGFSYNRVHRGRPEAGPMSEYVEFVREILEPLGDVRARRMFGGYGLYHQDLMFALVADGALYLKADEQSAQCFRDRNLGRFEYTKNGKATKMSYYAAPEEIFDDPDAAMLWASRAYEAALRARRRKEKAAPIMRKR